MKKILVVGAGFAGAVIARELANTSEYFVTVIDRRTHIGGNAFDEIHAETGNRYHKYGPHIFHTNSRKIFDYLSQFTDWLPYRHEVRAHVEGIGDVPMPVNLTTLSKIFGVELSTKEQVNALLHALRVDIPKPRNAWEFLVSNYGEKITDIFFARYTRKMWDLDLSDLPVSIVSRIPVKTDESRNYFNDNFQFMPRDGYASLFERIFLSPNIKFHPGENFSKEMENEYDFVFNSMPIDEYFSYEFGELPYRSIKFEHRSGESFSHEVPTINFTDYSKYTRKTDWNLYPGCGGGHTSLITYEQPCDYKKNSYERYYPVKTTDGAPQKRYRRYAELAAKNKKMEFVGRCGQYIYYDMDQVVASSLKTVRAFLKNQAGEIAKKIS